MGRKFLVFDLHFLVTVTLRFVKSTTGIPKIIFTVNLPGGRERTST